MEITPALVTLKGWDAQTFVATKDGAEVDAEWTVAPTGPNAATPSKRFVYTAPKEFRLLEQDLVIIATAGGESATAVIRLSNARAWILGLTIYALAVGLALLFAVSSAWHRVAVTSGTTTATVAIVNDKLIPGSLWLHPGEVVRLVTEPKTPESTWTSKICQPDGTCTAPWEVSEEQLIEASLQTKGSDAKPSMSLRLIPANTLAVLVLAVLFGAFGGLLHSLTSLVNFVGGRQFDPSWGLFYLARPLIGAATGGLVFLAFKSGLLGETAKVGSVFSIAAVAGLVGLFSDPALTKLKEIFDVVLGPKTDKRPGKMNGDAQKGAPAVSAKPTISKVDPATLSPNATALALTVTGTGFDAKSIAHVNDQPRATPTRSKSRLTLKLLPTDVAQPGKLAVTVVNSDGQTSDPFEVVVS